MRYIRNKETKENSQEDTELKNYKMGQRQQLNIKQLTQKFLKYKNLLCLIIIFFYVN